VCSSDLTRRNKTRFWRWPAVICKFPVRALPQTPGGWLCSAG
jgi:hypothetical protein